MSKTNYDMQIAQLREADEMAMLPSDTLADIINAINEVGVVRVEPQWLGIMGPVQEMTVADVIAAVATKGVALVTIRGPGSAYSPAGGCRKAVQIPFTPDENLTLDEPTTPCYTRAVSDATSSPTPRRRITR